MPSSLVLAVLVATSAFSAALFGLMAIAMIDNWRCARLRRDVNRSAAEPYVFLFDDHDLIDASTPARALLRSLPTGSSDWNRLVAFLAPRFPGFAATSSAVPGPEGREFRSADGSVMEFTGGAGLPHRLLLLPGEGAGQDLRIDALCHRAQEDEVASLRDVFNALPMPVWRADKEGTVIWANAAYLSVAAAAAGCLEEELSWPLPNLLERLPAPREGGPRRIALPGPQRRWFQIDTTPSGDFLLHVATPCDALVRAETTRDELMQTLAKTFADLPIGLAVFDRQRQLALFNPALSDLTDLGPEFLTMRPGFHAFFDRLREKRMIPEPRDYHGWRQAIADIETAAAAGHYEDTWNLPAGATYRVTARPHPDGALALWFEDVSADMSLTRRFRAEVQTCQAVFDSLDVAVAVFSAAGVMTLSNTAFSDFWGFEDSVATVPVDAADLAALWQAQTEPTRVWDDLVRYLSELGEREPWRAEVRRLAGPCVMLDARPLSGGSTMVEFRTEGAGLVLRCTQQERGAVPAI
jgi:PAS domain-containing protein